MNWSFALQAVIFASGIGGQLLVGRFDRRGFALWLASNVLLLATAVIQGLYGIAALYVVYAALCARQWVQWGALPLPKTAAAAQSAQKSSEAPEAPPPFFALSEQSSETPLNFPPQSARQRRRPPGCASARGSARGRVVLRAKGGLFRPRQDTVEAPDA